MKAQKQARKTGDEPSMANWRPTKGGFAYPKAAKAATPKFATNPPRKSVGQTLETARPARFSRSVKPVIKQSKYHR